MAAVKQAKKRAEMEAEKAKQEAKRQVDVMMKQAQVSLEEYKAREKESHIHTEINEWWQKMLHDAKLEAQQTSDRAAKILEDAMADGVVDDEEQKAVDIANAAKRRADSAAHLAAERTQEMAVKAQASTRGIYTWDLERGSCSMLNDISQTFNLLCVQQ